MKICGIRSPEEALWAVREGADALGFILVPKSKRYIEPKNLRHITANLPPFINKVGVFANESPEQVARIVRECSLDTIQLHGGEPAALYQGVPAAKLKVLSFQPADYNRSSPPTNPGIRKLELREAGINEPDRQGPGILDQAISNLSFEWNQRFIHGVLLDSTVKGQMGGTGVPLPWESAHFQAALGNLKDIGCPIILAGGLHPGNIEGAIQYTQPYGVDVSSGVEHGGRKSRELIQSFIQAAKFKVSGNNPSPVN